MSARKPLPPAFRDAAFRVADARVADVARGRLAARDLRRTGYGLRAPPAMTPPAALLPAFRTGDAYAGPMAARLWDLPLPRRLSADGRLHVSSVMPTAPMRRPGVVGSSRPRRAHVELTGLPVLSPEATWISLGGMLGTADLTAVADRLVSGTLRAAPLSSPELLARELEAAGSVRYVRRLRSALADVRVGSWSRPETLLRLAIVAAGLPEPALNAPIRLRSGRTVFLDLSWPDLRIDIEYDGRWHDEGGRPAADAARREELADDGWLSVHLRAVDLFPVPSPAVARLVRRRALRGAPAAEPIDFARMPRYEP